MVQGHEVSHSWAGTWIQVQSSDSYSVLPEENKGWRVGDGKKQLLWRGQIFLEYKQLRDPNFDSTAARTILSQGPGSTKLKPFCLTPAVTDHHRLCPPANPAPWQPLPVISSICQHQDPRCTGSLPERLLSSSQPVERPPTPPGSEHPLLGCFPRNTHTCTHTAHLQQKYLQSCYNSLYHLFSHCLHFV